MKDWKINNSLMAVNVMVHFGNKKIKKKLEKDDICDSLTKVTNN